MTSVGSTGTSRSHWKTSTGASRSQWAPLDFNVNRGLDLSWAFMITVGTAGPQRGHRDPSEDAGLTTNEDALVSLVIHGLINHAYLLIFLKGHRQSPVPA